MSSSSSIGRAETWLSRWGAPVTFVLMVVGMGLVLVSVVTRSPDTKSNYQASAADYRRTPLGAFGATAPYLGLQSGSFNHDVPPAQMFVQAGCSGCHGQLGEGGAVGPAIWEIEADHALEAMRDGGAGMPAFAPDTLTDAQVESLFAYLQKLRTANPNEPERKPARAGTAAE